MCRMGMGGCIDESRKGRLGEGFVETEREL
jgi:hypothetical protein